MLSVINIDHKAKRETEVARATGGSGRREEGE